MTGTDWKKRVLGKTWGHRSTGISIRGASGGIADSPDSVQRSKEWEQWGVCWLRAGTLPQHSGATGHWSGKGSASVPEVPKS